MIRVASDWARSREPVWVSIASVRSVSQRRNAAAAASRAPGVCSPSSAAATTGQPAPKSVLRRILIQPAQNAVTAATGSSSPSAATSPAAVNSPAYRVASSISCALPPGKW